MLPESLVYDLVKPRAMLQDKISCNLNKTKKNPKKQKTNKQKNRFAASFDQCLRLC